jgi:transposase
MVNEKLMTRSKACVVAHFVSRTLRQLGHEPRIIPAIYAKPFVKRRRMSRTTPRQARVQ